MFVCVGDMIVSADSVEEADRVAAEIRTPRPIVVRVNRSFEEEEADFWAAVAADEEHDAFMDAHYAEEARRKAEK